MEPVPDTPRMTPLQPPECESGRPADPDPSLAALRTSEERQRLTFEHAGIGMALCALDGRLERANPALCNFLGYPEHELLALRYHDVTHPDDLALDEARAVQLAGGAIPHYQVEKRYLRKDGRVVWGLLTVALLRDAAGAPTQVIAQVQDTTERRALEERLRQAEKMQAVGRLAGGVAHDFNNLLTVIGGSLEFVRDALGPGHAVQEDLALAAEAAGRARQLVQQLLAFGRRQAWQPRRLDVNAAVAAVAAMLRRVVGEDVAVETDLGAAGAAVRADPCQLEQVVMNLAVNARDAMPNGGVLRLRTAAGVPAGHVAIVVEDTGRGIGPDALPHIFEPFFTTKDSGRGTGLGLATVHAIVEQHGGRIEVESVPDVGSRFTVLLPLDAGVEAEDVPPHSPSDVVVRGDAPALDGGTILLVEDEAPVRAVVRRQLERTGYVVREAVSGAEALRLAETMDGPPDLLLSDVVMPGDDGPATAARLARRWPGLRVLFMSGYADDEMARRGLLPPESSTLEKPFTLERLAAAVRAALAALPGRTLH